MNSDIIALFEFYEKDKGIDRATLVEAVESALLQASRKSIGPARELRIQVHPKKGDIKAIAKLIAVEKVSNPFEEISIEKAVKIQPGAQLGDEIEVVVTPKDFGRIAAQNARQAIMQRLRQAEKSKIFEEFRDRAGEIVSGTVRRFDKSDLVIDLGRFEGVMPQRERVRTEDFSVGDRLRAYVLAVDNAARGPEIILSRSHNNFVRRLFEMEVSEIADRTVEIRSIARDPGFRTKVAVSSADPKVDPVGACVGLKGARVKNIVRELNGEKVDIIRWSEDPVEFLKEAIKPVKLLSVDLNAATNTIYATVAEDELSKAIGRGGQNARLASKLIGWEIKIDKDETKNEQFLGSMANAGAGLAGQLGIAQDLAEQLTSNGFTDASTIAEVDVETLMAIVPVSVEEAEQILAKARLQTH